MALRILGSTFEVKREPLCAVAREAFLYLGGEFEVNVRFVSQKRIRELNRVFRNRDLATDVLSFKIDETQPGGDIVISYKESAKQSKKLNIDIFIY